MHPTSRSERAEPLHAQHGLEQVAAALDRVPRYGNATNELRAAIGDYVRAQKAFGVPPESVLARVKTVIQSFPASRWGSDYTLEVQRELIAVVVAWCISAYYEER